MFKVGIIGLGYIGAKHLQRFNDIPGVEVAAIADLNEDCIAACVRACAVEQTFRDYQDLLALQDLDLIVVCLPNNLHARVSIEALKAGHNVFCEKPMATSVKDAEAMVDAARANQCMLSIAMNFRWQYFGPDAFHLKKLIEDGELGEIYYVRAHYLRRSTFPPTGYERWNLSQEESGGGALIDLGPHMLDLAMWLVDNYSPQSVSGFTHNGLMKYSPVDDFASGSVTLGNGARIQADLAWNSHNQTSWRISVYGEKGGAVIDAEKPAGRRITLFSEQENKPATETVSPEDIASQPEASIQEHVVKRLMAGEAPDCSAEKALQVMKVIEGWYQSSETGRDVTL
jgi:predicted dehydrogenase